MQAMQISRSGKPGLRLQEWEPRLVYITVCAVYFSVMIGFYIFNPFGFESPGRDTWHHLAVIRELIASPFDPSNPHIPTDEPSRYFTPITVLAALIGKTFSLSPLVIFSLLGAATCIAFCISCWYFARRYFNSSWAPVVLLSIFLFAWGEQLGHAGFHTFASFISSAAYPAMQALVLGIFSWTVCLAALDSDQNYKRNIILLTILTTIAIITHQFSAFIMLVGTGSFILFHKKATIRKQAVLIGALVCGGLLSLTWPYYNPLDVILSAPDSGWQSAIGKMDKPLYLFILAIPALFGCFGFRAGVDKRIRWEIAVPSAFFILCYFALVAGDAAIAHRFVPAAILYLHLGLTWAFLSTNFFKTASAAARYSVTAVILFFVVSGTYFASAPRLLEFEKREFYGPMLTSVAEMESHLPTGAISFATIDSVFPLQSTGRRVVSIPRPEPVAPSLPERQAATDRFFAQDTGIAERRRLIEQWNTTHIAFAPQDISKRTANELQSFGPSRTFTRGIQIITIVPPGIAR